jgi:hypothetical protein
MRGKCPFFILQPLSFPNSRIRKALVIGIRSDKTRKRFTRLKERLSGVIQTDRPVAFYKKI